MKFKSEQLIDDRYLEIESLKEENIIKQVIYDMLDKMPIEKVKELFNIEVLYGSESEIEDAALDCNDQLYDELVKLRYDKKCKFKASIIC